MLNAKQFLGAVVAWQELNPKKTPKIQNLSLKYLYGIF
jgi:hypothetical protein